jgi:hypothetical protein
MTRSCLPGVLAPALLAAVSGCGFDEPETAAHCVERFEKLLAASPDLRDIRVQPIFTYDTTQMDDVLEEFVGEGPELTGLRMTIAHGDSRPALEAFYKADVPPKGAAFAADHFSLFRVRGTPGSRDETLAAGCRAAPPDAPLVHVQWIALPPEQDQRGALTRGPDGRS